MGRKIFIRTKSEATEALRYLDDLFLIGPEKPMGYLPLTTIVENCKRDPHELQEYLERKGLVAFLFNDGEVRIPGGALYACHEESLQKLLESNIELLKAYEWPTSALEFVIQVALVHAENDTKLFDLVADAFGDMNNRLRSDRH